MNTRMVSYRSCHGGRRARWQPTADYRRASCLTTKFPLLVQFEFHPASNDAIAAAEYLHEVLNADPAVPGLQIPTCFTPDDGSGDPPEPVVATEADRVLVVLLADDKL